MTIQDTFKFLFFFYVGTAENPYESRNGAAARSLLVVTLTPPINPDYQTFRDAVNEYNEKPPFEFPNPFNKPKKVTYW